jgi:hypothetical protein
MQTASFRRKPESSLRCGTAKGAVHGKATTWTPAFTGVTRSVSKVGQCPEITCRFRKPAARQTRTRNGHHEGHEEHEDDGNERRAEALAVQGVEPALRFSPEGSFAFVSFVIFVVEPNRP